MSKDPDQIRELLEQLQLEHKDLDDIIARLSTDAFPDQLQLRRLKKRKLMLKDRIHRIKSMLIPDLDA